MKSKINMGITAIALAAAACTGCQNRDYPHLDEGANALMKKLNSAVAESVILYGHQDDYFYGHNWKNEAAAENFDASRSDVFEVCGSYPAVLGLDLGGIELGSELNIDRNPFSIMRKSIVLHARRGGISTFSWHPRNPLTGGDSWDISSKEVVASILEGGQNHEAFMKTLALAADYIESIKDESGNRIPLIFRPWHEHMGSWFWWGRDLCTAEQYKALWTLTHDYFVKERGLTNLVWAYSPNSGISEEEYMERYPGDGYVDILGLDCYEYMKSCEPGTPEFAEAVKDANARYTEELERSLGLICRLASDHGKIAVLSETGYESIPDSQWWTGTLLKAIENHPIAYVLTWRNAWDKPEHFYAPYPGSADAADFKAFAADRKIRMAE